MLKKTNRSMCRRAYRTDAGFSDLHKHSFQMSYLVYNPDVLSAGTGFPPHREGRVCVCVFALILSIHL